LAVFHCSEGEPTEIGELELRNDFTCFALSPDGRYAAAKLYRAGVVQVWNVSTGMMEREIRQPGLCDMTFVDNGRLLATSHRPGSVRLWKVATGEPVREWRTPLLLNLRWIPRRAFNDCHVETFRFTPVTVRDLKTGEILATLPVRGETYYAVAIVECLLLVAWSVAWVVSGRQCRKPRPLLDAALVHGVVALVLVARLVSTESPHIVRLPMGLLLLAQLVAASCLAVMWAAAADHRWMVRVSATLAAMTGCAAAMVSFTPYAHWGGRADWDNFVAAISLVVSLACGALVALRFGLRVSRELPVVQRGRDARRFQVTLRDLLVFTLAIAVFVAVARFFEPPYLGWQKTLFLICEGAMFAMLAAIGAWSALSRARWPVRVAVLILACVFSAAHWPLFQTYQRLGESWFYLSAHVLVAFIVVATLLIFRFHGNRIRKGVTERSPGGDRGCEERVTDHGDARCI